MSEMLLLRKILANQEVIINRLNHLKMTADEAKAAIDAANQKLQDLDIKIKALAAAVANANAGTLPQPLADAITALTGNVATDAIDAGI